MHVANTGGHGRGNQAGNIIGGVILHDKKQYWCGLPLGSVNCSNSFSLFLFLSLLVLSLSSLSSLLSLSPPSKIGASLMYITIEA